MWFAPNPFHPHPKLPSKPHPMPIMPKEGKGSLSCNSRAQLWHLWTRHASGVGRGAVGAGTRWLVPHPSPPTRWGVGAWVPRRPLDEVGPPLGGWWACGCTRGRARVAGFETPLNHMEMHPGREMRRALVVEWQHVCLPRMRPGFDSRPTHSSTLLHPSPLSSSNQFSPKAAQPSSLSLGRHWLGAPCK